MTTKLIILLTIGLIVLGLLVWMIVRAIRYRRNHPNEPLGTGLHLLLCAIILFAFHLSPFNSAMAQGGHGTPNNPYRIRTADELKAFANCLGTGQQFYFYNYGYSKQWICSTTPPTSGEYDTIPAHGEGKYFLVPNDIVLNSGNLAACDGDIDPAWTPWPETGVFKGHFLGNMHTISGMYIDRPAGSEGVGFFSKVEGDAHVEKLGIINSYVRVASSSSEPSSNIGGLVGELSGGRINDCFFEGSIRTSGNHVGGLVGLMTSHAGLLPQVSVCSSAGHLNCSGDYVAGLVGKVEKGTVRHCYSAMAVRTTDVVGVALSGANPTNGGIGTDEYIASHHVGGIYGYTLNPSGGNSYDPDVDSIRVDTCYFDWQMSDLPSIPGSTSVPADWRDNRGAAALSTYDMTYYSMMYFDIKNQKPSLWKNTYLTNVYPYPDPFNDPINVTYRLEMDYPNSPLVTTSLIPLIDVFMKPNGNGQSTINNMNDQERKHMKLSNFTESFVLWKGCDSLDITWTTDNLWSDAVSRVFYAPDNSWNVYLQKQGVVRFTIEAVARTQGATGRTRYFDAVVNIPPYVGSAENPFLISNLEDFLAFRDGINANQDFVYHRFLIPRDSLSKIHWMQTADIDLVSVGDWTPVSNFTGYYDGKGHKLMNLTMTNGTDRALFVYSKGEISNLVLEDPHITDCGGSSAALATLVKGGSFENCGVTYSAGSNNHSPLQFVGNNCAALIGTVDSVHLSSIHITGCFNSCSVVNNINNGYAAGLVGSVNADTCFIERCFNAGDITASNGTVHPFVGHYSNSTRRIFTNCYNVGVLTGNQVEVESTNTTFYNDYHVNPVCNGATKVATRYFIDSTTLVRPYLGDSYWLYEEGRYPRLRWTDSSSIRLAAIAACTPRLALDSFPLSDTMTVDSFHDLNNLRNIVNGNYMVIYKDYLLPHYVQDIVFSLTHDINLSDITSNWIPIGTKRFAGTFFGNNHTLSQLNSTRSVVGLFGTLTGKVYDLNITVNTIIGADTVGAVCAILNGGRIENCSVKKYNNTSDNLYGAIVGGIAGVSLTANDSIIGCFNYVDVMGTQCIGGIIAKDGNVKNSVNLGDVTGSADCIYIGGISGRNTNVTGSLNTGIITALPGNTNADNWVGGIVGEIHNSQFTIHNCYNAGIVNGENRKYVGGICGEGAPQYCYVSNTVRSTGAHLGSIVGIQATSQPGNQAVTGCCYDNQMSPVGGIDGSDQSGAAEGMPTASLLGTGGDNNFYTSYWGQNASSDIWYYSDDYYPQLQGVRSINAILSKASAMRAKLDTTETYSTVSHQFTLNYSDGGSWQRIGGSNCLTIGTSPNNNLITVTIPSTDNHPAQGFITLGFRGAGTNDPVYRKVQLWVNLTEANPIIIRNADELKKFRTIINQGSGYYNSSTQTFITTGSYSASQYVRITDGGRDLYFKLNADVDLAFHGTTSSGSSYNVLDLWTSIGTPNRPFLGHFDGGNHTVANFLVPEGDNQGFFGYIYGGSVKNLTIAGAITNHNTTGNHRSLLCGYLNGGTIRNCFITQVVGSNYHSPSRISAVSGRNIGFICGTNHYGRIVRCKTDMTQIENATYTHGSCFGGIVGYNDYGVVDSCKSHLAINPGVTIDTVGGIVGYNHCGILRADTSYNNSYNKSIMSYVGCIAGYSESNTITNHQSRISNCYVDMESRIPSIGDYIGGVVGKMQGGAIDSCGFYGTIIAQGNYIGGIAGFCSRGASITGSYSVGTVCQSMLGDCIGGIAGILNDSCSIGTSFNSSIVTGRYSVGGIVGRMQDNTHFSDCYNTGIVKGLAQVGGLVGIQSEPTAASGYGYSAGWVEGSSMVGAVCGFTSDATMLHDLHYDSLMCFYKGVNEEDVTGVTAHTTTELTGLTFSGRPWEAGTATSMYPRLSVFYDTDVSKISALALQISKPFNLPYTPNIAYALPTYTPTTGSFSWVKVSSSDTTATISGTTITSTIKRGRMRIRARVMISGRPIYIRPIQFSFGISEDYPLEISQLGFTQLRNHINQGVVFYYSNGAFYATNQQITNATLIPIGADGIHFKLKTDVNYVTNNWTPIGTSDSPFLGYLDGDGHAVHVRLAQSTADNRGIFGYMQGRISNIIVDSVNVTGGGRVGSLAGYCCGTIRNCRTRGSAIIKGTSAVGGLVGDASYSQFFDCYNGFDVTGSSMVGGLVGRASDNGAIERSFNYGYIKSTASNSLVAGLVGMIQNSNFKIQNCYNTGAVDGTLNVGSFTGMALSSQTSISNCYNAGYINGSISVLQPAITNCFNDRQMNPHTGDACTNLYISEMLGEGLRSYLGDTWWSYNNNEYPRLKNFETTAASTVSVKSLNMGGHMQVDNIVKNFVGDTSDGVKWYRHGTGTALNAPNPATANGTFTLNTCGADSLKVTLVSSGRMEHRMVPVVVTGVGITIDTVRACSAYNWQPTNNYSVTLVDSGFHSYQAVGGACEETKAIELYFADPIEVSIFKNDACMDSYWSKYGYNIGRLKAVATGGFGDVYSYTWSRSGGDIDQECYVEYHPDSLRYLSSDYYYLTTADITPHSVCVSHDTILVDEYSFNYLATKWGNCVDTADGWIEVMLRQFEFNRDGSPYTIECWDSTHTLIAEHTIPAYNPPDESGVPKGYDTLSNLANGLYYLTITDRLGCYQDKQIKVNDPINPKMTIRPRGLTKVYDGQPVSVNDINVVEYDDNWKVPERAEYYITSGQWRQLALRIGDSLIVNLKTPNASITDVGTLVLEIDDWEIKDAETGKEKTCLYHFYPQKDSIVILPKSVIVTAHDYIKRQGDPDPYFNFDVMGLVRSEDFQLINGNVTVTREPGDAPGTYTIMPTGDLLVGNYELTFVPGTLTILDTNLTAITVTGNSLDAVYDGTVKSVSGYTVSGLPEGYTLNGITTSDPSGTVAGTYYNNVSSGGVVRNAQNEDVTSQFDIRRVNGRMVIAKRPVTISPINDSKEYDNNAATDPEFTATVTGLVGNETLNYTLERTAGQNVGYYPITVTADFSPNYEVTAETGVFTIYQKEATVKGDTIYKTYGSNVDTILTATVTGAVAGDTLNYSLDCNQGVNAGSYPIVVTLGSNQNYRITKTDGVLIVQPKAATITANNKVKTYGDADPTLTATVSGTVGSDVLNYSLSRGIGEDAGTYAITVDESGNPNYTVATVGGTFTITKKAAMIAADAKSKTYGSSDPTLTATVSGAVESNGPVYTLSRAAGESIGTYTISVNVDANDNGNYDISVFNSELTITRAMAVVAAEGHEKIYGDADTTLTAIVSGLRNGDPASTISYTVSREPGEDIGKYAITPTGNELQGNYALTYVTDTLTITRATATVTADDKEKIAASPDPLELTVTITGLKNGDDESVISYNAPSREAGEAIGTYAITVTGDAEQGNYNVVFVPGTFRITQPTEAVIRIAGHQNTAVYDGTEHTVNGYNITSNSNPYYSEGNIIFNGTATASRTNTDTTYMGLTAGDFLNNDGNFDVTFIVTDGYQAITPAQLTVTTSSASKEYDGTPLTAGPQSIQIGGETVYPTSNSQFTIHNSQIIVTTTGSQTDVGQSPNTYTIDWGTTNSNNYHVSDNLGTLKVTTTRFNLAVGNSTWHAIASPMHDPGLTYESLDSIAHLTDADYDLFRYDEASATWENVKAHSFNFDPGRGYIYRRATAATLSFAGQFRNDNIDGGYLTVGCSDNTLKGFNLIGNPYMRKVYKGTDFGTSGLVTGWYSLNTDGTWLSHLDSDPIDTAQAALVKVSGSTPFTLSFTYGSKSSAPVAQPQKALAFTVTGNNHEDIVYALFDYGEGLPKISHLNENAPSISIPVDNCKYAIAIMDDTVNAFPLVFNGKGEYTLVAKTETLPYVDTFFYLHLIDRVTGKDIDLLQQPKYTFHSSGEDTDRFWVKLTPDARETRQQDNFAYWNGSAWIIEGSGEFEVFDILGRKIFVTEIISSPFSVSRSLFPSAGVYILRLNGKSQKIVIR